MNLHKTTFVNSNISITVRSLLREQTFFDPALHATYHVDRLLLSVEARHARQHTALHSACGRIIGGLRYRKEWHAEFGFQALKLNIVEQVSSRPVNLVEQNAIKLDSVLLGVCNQFLERLAIVVFARRFCNSPELDDRSILPLGVGVQSVDLNVEREAFTLLFTAADTCQCNEPLLFLCACFGFVV